VDAVDSGGAVVNVAITDVRAYLYEQTVPEHRFREGLPTLGGRQRALWIRVLTDAGVDGWSHVPYWGSESFELASRHLRSLAVGRDALSREALWRSMWELDRMEELPIYFLGALDVALWDIAAKVANLPLHKLVGGYRDAIPAYASLSTFASEEEFLDVIDECRGLGFGAFKLHGWGDVRRDISLCRRVREHVPDADLMFDAMGAYFPEEALRVGRALEEAAFAWYEEPVREFNVGVYQSLARTLDIPIVVEATDGAHYRAAELLVSGAVDVVQAGTDVHGVTGALRIAHVADALGRTVEFHTGGPVHRHLCCAVPNTRYFESLVLWRPVEREDGLDDDGFVHPPGAPGVGLEPDLERLEADAVRAM
jgi:L-alanine-DL-glutamate epimerase-like enolase superfamily enzyme